MLVVLLRHVQHVSGVRHEDIPTFFVRRHILRFAFLEHIEFGIVVGLNPASFVHLERLPFAFGLVLVFESVLDDFELELSHCSDDLTAVELAHKELRYTFVHELVDTLVELFLLHGVGIVDVFEHFRREGRQTLEMQVFTCGERVSDFEVSGVRQTHYISCKRFIDRFFLLRHEAGRSRKTHLLILAHVIIIGVAQELTGTA